MAPISRGFGGRRRRDVDPTRVPPGQYTVNDFPVLSAGPAPRPPPPPGAFPLDGGRRDAASWTWDEFLALPQETFTVDIHCVTKWSKLDTGWTGVSVDTLLEGIDTEAGPPPAWPDGAYTSTLPLEDVPSGQAWVVHPFAGEPLEAEHGGPARLL